MPDTAIVCPTEKVAKKVMAELITKTTQMYRRNKPTGKPCMAMPYYKFKDETLAEEMTGRIGQALELTTGEMPVIAEIRGCDWVPGDRVLIIAFGMSEEELEAVMRIANSTPLDDPSPP